MVIYLITIWILFIGTILFTVITTEKQDREFNEALEELDKAFKKRRGYQ